VGSAQIWLLGGWVAPSRPARLPASGQPARSTRSARGSGRSPSLQRGDRSTRPYIKYGRVDLSHRPICTGQFAPGLRHSARMVVTPLRGLARFFPGVPKAALVRRLPWAGLSQAFGLKNSAAGRLAHGRQWMVRPTACNKPAQRGGGGEKGCRQWARKRSEERAQPWEPGPPTAFSPNGAKPDPHNRKNEIDPPARML